MFRNNFKAVVSLLLALSAVALAPAGAAADWLGFRNDLKQPIIVRTFIDTPEGLRPDSVMILYPGEVRWSLVKDTNTRLVIVSDVKPPRKVLGQHKIPAPATSDALYGVQQRQKPQSTGALVDLVKVAGKRP